MKALVVYESMFGDTPRIAEAIGDGLSSGCDVAVVPVGPRATEWLRGVDLLVVGGPTHVRGMSRPKTRDGARQQAAEPESGRGLEPGATGPGVREWMAELGSASDAPNQVRSTR